MITVVEEKDPVVVEGKDPVVFTVWIHNEQQFITDGVCLATGVFKLHALVAAKIKLESESIHIDKLIQQIHDNTSNKTTTPKLP